MLRRFIPTLALFFVVVGAFCQTAASPGAAAAIPGSLRILAPKSGERISHAFVELRFKLAAQASAAGSPTFQLRLDSSDPVKTTDTAYTFTGVQAGGHTASVELVDANNVPVQGSRAEVNFVVLPSANPQSVPPPVRRQGRAQLISAAYSNNTAGKVVNLAFQQPDAQANQAATPDSETSRAGSLPQSESPLPLLSVIGVGILIGGIASALRTRPKSRLP